MFGDYVEHSRKTNTSDFEPFCATGSETTMGSRNHPSIDHLSFL